MKVMCWLYCNLGNLTTQHMAKYATVTKLCVMNDFVVFTMVAIIINIFIHSNILYGGPKMKTKSSWRHMLSRRWLLLQKDENLKPL